MTTAAAVLEPLGASVLVLNRFYVAIHVINVRRAFSLLCRDLAEVVHLEDGQFANYDFESWREISDLKSSFKEPDEDWIRSVNFEIQVPRVIRLLFFERLPKQVVRFNRRNVFARDGNRCQYCGRSFPTSELSLDHIVRAAAVARHRGKTSSVAASNACQERWAHSTGSPHAAGARALSAQTQPAAEHEVGQSQVRKLEDVSR